MIQLFVRRRPGWRCAVARSLIPAASIWVLSAFQLAEAQGMQQKLQGAWALVGAACDQVFAFKNGLASFVSYGGERAPGFIVKGDNIEGAQASCKLLSQTEQSGSLAVVLGCKEQIIFDKVVVHLRFMNDNELMRFDPVVPEISMSYRRCQPQ
jgi:hypothetical protein